MPGSRTNRLPAAWSDKDKRMYEHVKKTYRDRGRSEGDAAEIAARTVNDYRRDEGRAKSKTSRQTGNPNVPLEDRSVEELRNRAAELKIKGRSSMTKAKLVRAIRAHND
ncbi:MAG: Rho termination factor N-terminal domain-containing protein [Phycisphaerales bacterium]